MKKKSSFQDLFYIFIISSIFGWLVEFLFFYVRKGIFVNHSSLVLGPFCLAYGFGGVALTVLLERFDKKSWWQIFLISYLSGTVLEYIMSFGMELVMGFCAWDYSNLPFNINGRVCLLYSLFWGVLGIIWIKLIYPIFKKITSKLANKFGKILMYFLLVFLLFDTLLTICAFHRVKQYTKGLPPKNLYEEFLDAHFGYDYLNDMYIHLDKLEGEK